MLGKLLKNSILSVFVLMSIHAFSNLPMLKFETLKLEDGFSSSRAISLIQDSKGYLWIGTWNGLNRYDGYDVDVFYPKLYDTTSISNREITALIESSDERIWIGTSNGLNVYDPKTNVFDKYKFSKRILALYEDEDGNIWIGTWKDGVYCLNPKNGEQVHYLGTSIVTDIVQDDHHNLWLATYGGLMIFDRANSSFTTYVSKGPNSLRSNTIEVLERDIYGNIWLGTWGGGLSKAVRNELDNTIHFQNYSVNSKTDAPLEVYSLFADENGNLWIGSWNRGLWVLESDEILSNTTEVSYTNYRSDLLDQYSLSDNNISSIFVDKSNTLWVGGSNLSKVSLDQNGFSYYNSFFSKNDAYYNNSINVFAEDAHNNLWVGKTNSLARYSCTEGNYKLEEEVFDLSYVHQALTYNANGVLSLLKTEKGLLVGTNNAGLLFYPKNEVGQISNQNYKFYNYSTPTSIPGVQVTTLFQSDIDKDVFWLGTNGNGFAKCRITDDDIEVQAFNDSDEEYRFSGDEIRQIIEDREGNIWFTALIGLNRLDVGMNQVNTFHHADLDTSSINDNVINVLYEDQLGNLWVGTNQGLNKKVETIVNGKRNIYFKSYPNIEYLNNSLIRNIIQDDSTHIWVECSEGLLKFDVENETVVQDIQKSFIWETNIRRNSAFKTNRGNILFGGVNGFIDFSGKDYQNEHANDNVCITGIYVNNAEIQFSPNSNKLDHNISYATKLKLNAKENQLRIEFSAMNFQKSYENNYSYILEGFDESWNDVGKRNNATYTGISPGNYTFKVLASNGNGEEVVAPTLLEIIILPPWWNTTLAKVVWLVLIMTVILLVNMFLLRKNKERNQLKLQKMEVDKLNEVAELKARFFTNITHDFRTPLALIIGPVEDLITNEELPQEIKEDMVLIKRNADRLLKMVNQLIEFRKIEHDKLVMYPTRIDFQVFMDSICYSFQKLAELRGIKINFESEYKNFTVWLDKDKIERVLFNLISNAIKFSDNKSEVWIRLKQSRKEPNSYFVIEIEDQGIGISEENKQFIFDRFFQANQNFENSTGGIGLYIAKTIVEKHGGEIRFDSRLNQGTKFVITLPIDTRILIEHQNQPEVSEEIQDENQSDNEIALDTPVDEKEKKVVLVVEDDVDLNNFISKGLSSSYKTIKCFNGDQALEYALNNNVDIVISDIMMPIMDGFELCRKLNSNLSTSHIPLIFLTARSNQKAELEGLQLGALDYIHKPFNLTSLHLKVKNILEKKEEEHKIIKDRISIEPEGYELSSLDEQFLKKAVEILDENIEDEKFDVNRFADEMGMSYNMMYRKLKALTGETAVEFIRSYRLKTAAKLLIQKKRTITEINYMVGFSSPSYFAKSFKKMFGCTPTEYIDKNSSEEDLED